MFKSMASVFSPGMTSHDNGQSPSIAIELDDPEGSDPSVHVDALPKDYPIHLLAEAREYYGNNNTKPPFVLRTRPNERLKDVVIPTKHGLRPKREKTRLGQIVAMDWDEHNMFWTLDLNGRRYVVKPFPGKAQGGMRYLYWAGPRKGFEEKPLALSYISTFQPSFLPINRKRENSTDISDSSSSDSAAHQGIPAKKRRSEVSSMDIDPLYSVTPPAARPSDVHVSSSDYQPEPSQPNTSGSTTTVNNRNKNRKQRLIARIEDQLGRKFEQIFTPWAGDDQDVSRDTLGTILKIIGLMRESSPQNISRTLNRAVNEGSGKREVAGGRKPTQPRFKELEATLQVAQTTSGRGGTTDEHLSSRDPSLNGNRPTRLSPHQQSHTTLIVRVAPFAKYQPVTLSECMSLQSFYVEVLGAWGIRGDSVAEVSVTFTWKDPEDPLRVMVMNSRREACFAHLIKQIDKAPGWDEGDKEHVLDVEIVLKE
ncbi:hypothetical protein BDR22DRAFT_71062 [Usnea florida]